MTILPADEQNDAMPKDDVMATKQAKEKVRTLRLGAPIKSCGLTNGVMELASSFFAEAWV